MKKTKIALVILAALALMMDAQAKKSSSSEGGEEISTGMTGKWGVGFDTIPGANSTAPSAATLSLSTGNALALRYWNAERTAWEGLLAFNSGSAPGGTDASGKPTNNSNSVFGLGVGYNYAWKKPVENFLVKLGGHVSYASSGQTTVTLGKSIGVNTSTLALMATTGFEAFIPAWPCLSVEGNVSAGLSTQSTSSDAPGATTSSTSSIGISGNGFTPISVAAHYYF